MTPPPASVADVFVAFLRLGLTSFGGPIAHLGYFQTEFVERRRWLDARAYADLVALCQFLPGPTSSQVGLAIGLQRAGWRGALAAWSGFTLPSAVLMIGFGYGVLYRSDLASSGALHGLKLVAVAVVAQAVWSMAKSLCPDRPRAAVAIVAAMVCLVLPSATAQIAALVLAGLLGRWLVPAGDRGPVAPAMAQAVSPRAGLVALALFALLFAGLPLVASTTGSSGWALVDGFYRAGALVFGGGHVMLPLLQAVVAPAGQATSAAAAATATAAAATSAASSAAVPTVMVAPDTFLAGYGAAQALPGPLTSFAAFLGTVMTGPLSGWTGGLVLMVALFAAPFLLLIGVLPFWDTWRQRPGVRPFVAGINAGVVGLLLAALYDPVWTSTIHGRVDFALALGAFGLLVFARVSPVLVVLGGAVVGAWIG